MLESLADMMVYKQKAANGFAYLDHLDIILGQDSPASQIIGYVSCIYPFNEIQKMYSGSSSNCLSMRNCTISNSKTGFRNKGI